jgi:hypothetical protein
MSPAGGSGGGSRRGGWLAALVAVTVALCVANLLLATLAHARNGAALAALPVAGLGLLIARKARGSPIGWLLLGFGVWWAAYFDIGQYAVLAVKVHHDHWPAGRAAVDVTSELWNLDFLILPIVVLLFPDGRLSRAWRRVLWGYLAAVILGNLFLLWAGAEQVSVAHIEVTPQGQLVDNPGATGALVPPFVVCIAAIPVFWASFVVRQVLRWRRASAELRQQLKWLTTGGVLTLVGLAATVLLAQFTGPLIHAGLVVSLLVGIFSLPVALVVAILKYHLYDIDRIISRTVSYAILTGAVVALYAAVITLTTRAFGFSSSVAVAASTLGAAAAFNPLRVRLQRAVDRRFNRIRYDARRAVAAFAERLRTEVHLDAVSHDLLGAIQATLEPSLASIWLPVRAGPGATVRGSVAVPAGPAPGE